MRCPWLPLKRVTVEIMRPSLIQSDCSFAGAATPTKAWPNDDDTTIEDICTGYSNEVCVEFLYTFRTTHV